MENSTPDALSRYHIVRPLGAGGMGEVFLAEDGRLGRQVALKILPSKACSEPALRLRFVQEARAAAMLAHPNICTVYDVGESDDGRVFITMEYIEGTTLAERLAGSVLPLEQTLDLAIQAGEAISEAHRKGVIHRDLKPGNLMLTSRGQLKVVDFGLAKITSAGAETEDAPTGLQTSPGLVLGTISYMSPEQAFAEEVDGRSDIFSFGIVLYQLASGQRPFAGRSNVEIIDSIVHADPPALDRSRVPEELERIVRKCLEKKREHRYQSMTDLLVDMRAVQRAIRGESSVASRPVAAKDNLPLQINTFVGREGEIDEVRAFLRSHRLVTITGTAGSGKTRLALETGARVRDSYRHGVWFVDLAVLADPELVATRVGEVLQVREEAGRPLIDSLSLQIKTRHLLLIIDNCEHLLVRTAEVVDLLLRSAPDLTVLTTSREPLNVAGECTWSVPPLAVPQPRTPVTVEAAESFDAVHLFSDRARAAQPRFALSESNLEAVLGICRALDGIPLAIELAAARMRVMSADEIRKRLDDAFHLLTGGSRGTLPRQQTLRAAVDWSYDLLTGPERALFSRLAIFYGGFDLAAVEQVCPFGVVDANSALDELTHLVEKSLVIAETSAGGSMRFRLLEPLRQYAREKLVASGDEETAQRRHFEYFGGLSERAYDQRIEASALWLETLEGEHDNLRAALRWAGEHDRVRELQLAGALAWFWHLHSHIAEGRGRLRRVLSGTHERTGALARALWGESMLAALQNDRESRARAEESLAIWREVGDQKEVALALEATGWSLWLVESDNAGALARFEESLRIHQQRGEERLVNRTNLAICQVLVSDGDVARARPLAEKALAIAREHGEVRDIHNAYHFLADCALIEGDVRRAEDLYRESLRAAMSYGDRVEMTYEVEGVAMSIAGEHAAKALRLSGAVAEERAAVALDVNVPFWDALVARYIAPVVAAAGADAVRLRAEGAGMGFEAACRSALSANGE
jgi:non-specific serine/threonine protein kinase